MPDFCHQNIFPPAAAAAKESSSSTSTASGSGTSAEKGKSSSSAKSSDKSSSSSSSSPQIYPWMKRVHLGQSKLLKANNRGFVSRERGEGRGLSKSKCRHSLTPLSPSVPFPFSSPLLFNPVTLSHASMRAPARKLRLPLALCFLCSLFVAFGCWEHENVHLALFIVWCEHQPFLGETSPSSLCHSFHLLICREALIRC